MKNYIQRLQDAIRQLHGSESSHIATVSVTEQSQGRILWQGDVEMFSLSGHRQAKRCYAWSHLGDEKKEHFTAVLELPPVDSPRAAVRAALVGVKNDGKQT